MPFLATLAGSLSSLAVTVGAIGSMLVALVVIIRSVYHVVKLINQIRGR